VCHKLRETGGRQRDGENPTGRRIKKKKKKKKQQQIRLQGPFLTKNPNGDQTRGISPSLAEFVGEKGVPAGKKNWKRENRRIRTFREKACTGPDEGQQGGKGENNHASRRKRRGSEVGRRSRVLRLKELARG